MWHEASAHPEVLCHQSQLLPFEFLRRGDLLGRAVVKIQREDGACGTGFLVAPDVLITNHHVLPAEGIARKASVIANYEDHPASDVRGRPVVVTPSPATLFVTNPELDVTFCGVAGLAYLGHIPLDRDSRTITRGEPVSIIQHPRGRPKEIALRDNRVNRIDPIVIQYSCDTEPGSSGSPVFNTRWGLVAIHHASVLARSCREFARRRLEIDGRFLNEGIRISAIASWLESAGTQQGAHLEYLRSLVGGVDPAMGFFGSLGLHSRAHAGGGHGRAAPRPRQGRVDLAYWEIDRNLEASDRRLDQLSALLARLNCDVWFLDRVEGETGRRLNDLLRIHHQLEYRIRTQRSAAGKPLTILFRKARSLHLDWLHGLDRCVTHAMIQHRRSGQPESQIHVVHVPETLSSGEITAIAHQVFQAHSTAALLVGGSGVRSALQQLRGYRERETGLVCAEAGNHSRMLILTSRQSCGPTYLSSNLCVVHDTSNATFLTRDREIPLVASQISSEPPMLLRLSFKPQP
jgi:hypothetical protein